MGNGFAGLDPYDWIFGIGGVYGNYGRRPYGALAIAGLVDNQPRAGAHFAEIFHRAWIGDSIPDGCRVARKIGKGIFRRFGF